MIPKCHYSSSTKYHYDGWYHPPQNGVEPIRQNTTALILGWAGSQPRYVQVYSKLFAQEFGIGAHGYTLPMELTFNYDQEAQKKLLALNRNLFFLYFKLFTLIEKYHSKYHIENLIIQRFNKLRHGKAEENGTL